MITGNWSNSIVTVMLRVEDEFTSMVSQVNLD